MQEYKEKNGPAAPRGNPIIRALWAYGRGFFTFIADSTVNFGHFDRIARTHILKIVSFFLLAVLLISQLVQYDHARKIQTYIEDEGAKLVQAFKDYPATLEFKDGKLVRRDGPDEPLVHQLWWAEETVRIIFSSQKQYAFDDKINIIFLRDYLRLTVPNRHGENASVKTIDFIYTTKTPGAVDVQTETTSPPLTVPENQTLTTEFISYSVTRLSRVIIDWLNFIELLLQGLAVFVYLPNIFFFSVLPVSIFILLGRTRSFLATMGIALKISLAVTVPNLIIFNLLPIIGGQDLGGTLDLLLRRSNAGFYIFMVVTLFYTLIGFIMFYRKYPPLPPGTDGDKGDDTGKKPPKDDPS